MGQLHKARLDELDFDSSVIRILKGKGIETLGDLTSKTRDELLSIRFLGRGKVAEIEAILDNMDLKLNER